jgi:plastocyanin
MTRVLSILACAVLTFSCSDDESSGGGSGGSPSGGAGGSGGATTGGAGGAGGSAAGAGGSAAGAGGSAAGAGGSAAGAGGGAGSGDAGSDACTKAPSPAGQVVDCVGATIAKTVDIQGFVFAPASATLKVGDVVKFDNQDASAHTATSGVPGCIDDAWDTGNIAGGAAKCVKLTAAGSFPYFCTIHPSMVGALTVTN